MHLRPHGDSVKIVSFSGIDGAGKTTQILNLCARLKQAGLRLRLVVFWDDVARLTRFRESAGHALFKGDKGVGSPSAPIDRRDKNVRSGLMTVVRLALYTLDAFSARASVHRIRRCHADVVVLDRYIYDELANLNMESPLIRSYIRLIARIVPRPHISYLLDADPTQARARKPEYPVEFLRSNRQAYRTLSNLIGGMTVIEPMTIEDTERRIMEHFLKEFPFKDDSSVVEVPVCENSCDGAYPAETDRVGLPPDIRTPRIEPDLAARGPHSTNR